MEGLRIFPRIVFALTGIQYEGAQYNTAAGKNYNPAAAFMQAIGVIKCKQTP